jgi:integrase
LEIISREAGIEEDQKPLYNRRYGLLRVRKSWNTRFKKPGPTKGGYWRSVPISSEFYWFLLNEMKVETMRSDDHVFKQSWEWDKGEQTRFIRGFCEANKIPSIKFHTFRACFATQLISTGVPATVVMKICGWKDMKTMQRYIRLAGIDEAGATEVLRFIPTEEAVMEKVVNMYGYRNKE